tara:strand:+ start:316 stop:960 length:645 start_codon:yes stop_codon:yes gene_type:complete
MNKFNDTTFLTGINYLKSKDKVFQGLYENIGILSFKPRDFDLTEFCKIIIGQQLSSKAADTIFARLQNFLEQEKIKAESIINLNSQSFREIGISFGKSKYLVQFAKKITEYPRYFEELKVLSSDEAYNHLIQLQGVGPWTANIIQLFHLEHLDVFPFGDVSLEKVYSKLYNTKLKIGDKNSYEQINWASPYKGILAIYLWKYLDMGLFERKKKN